jgi:hypothetical protein
MSLAREMVTNMKKPNLDALMVNATRMTNENLLHRKPVPQKKQGKKNEKQ